MQDFKTFIEEGRNDPAIFHAIFMAGGPGSGKSWVAKSLGLRALGYVEINSDRAFEMGMKKSLLSLRMPDNEKFPRDIVRGLAKKTTQAKQGHAVEGRLGMVIDGTGSDIAKVKKMKKQLELLGYETAMVFVNTSLDVAIERDDMRSRSLGPKMVTKLWADVQTNTIAYHKLFGKKLIKIDNSNAESTHKYINKAYTKIMTWSKKLPENPAVINWMNET
jgi:adenylate kinase family enzyme